MRICIERIELLQELAEEETADLRVLWNKLRKFNVNDHCESISTESGPPERQFIELESNLHKLGHYAACQYAQELQAKWHETMLIVKRVAAKKGIKLDLKLDPDMDEEFRVLGLFVVSDDDDDDSAGPSVKTTGAGVPQSVVQSAATIPSRSTKKKETRGRGQQLHRYRAGRR